MMTVLEQWDLWGIEGLGHGLAFLMFSCSVLGVTGTRPALASGIVA